MAYRVDIDVATTRRRGWVPWSRARISRSSKPKLAEEGLGGSTFLDAVLESHRSHHLALEGLRAWAGDGRSAHRKCPRTRASWSL